MTILFKNRDFVLHHVEEDTGCSLLYSRTRDECVFLNTLATGLWRIPLEHVDTEREPMLFERVSKIRDAAEYMCSTITAMRKKGLLVEKKEEQSDKESAYQSRNKADAGKKNGGYQLGQIYFYATRQCNSRCYHCYQPTQKIGDEASPLQEDRISREDFLRFVRRSLPLGVRSIKITGGEPLLRPDLLDIIREITSIGLRTSIETNGSLIDERIADSFKELGVRVSLSLDGSSASVHDPLRGHPGSFEKVINALQLLSERGCEPQLIMALSRWNVDEIEDVLSIASTYSCKLVKLNPVNTLGAAHALTTSNILLSISELLALYSKRKKLEEKSGIFVYLEGPPAFSTIEEIMNGHAAVCPFMEIIGVLADGSLSYCGIGNSYPELIFGRAQDADFNVQEFWRRKGTPLDDVREIMSKRLQGVCGECILESLCRGACRALAYGEFGHFAAPHPWCQSAYDSGVFPIHYLKK